MHTQQPPAQPRAPHRPPAKFLQTPILRRSAVLKQRTVHRWRRHIFLGRKHAKQVFLRTSSLCNYWLSSFAALLCFLSATWGHLMADTEISRKSILAAMFFPLDFVLLFGTLLGIFIPRILDQSLMESCSCTQITNEVVNSGPCHSPHSFGTYRDKEIPHNSSRTLF